MSNNNTEKTIQKIIKNKPNPKLIREAFEFAQKAYKDRFRLSGENYIHHAVRVALMLDKMSADQNTIIFALLHDILDDNRRVDRNAEVSFIEKKFGKEVAHLAERISELNRIRYALEIDIRDKNSVTKERMENLRRMFLAIAGDLRVVLVELASRLDGLKFLTYLPKDKQKLYALETLQIFVPIAGRLGLGQMRRSLEDDSFAYLLPNQFNKVKKQIEEQYEKREKYLKKFILHIRKIFKKERVKILDINWRTKSYWSTYKKLLKKDMDFNKIHDLIALRIITDNTENCYKVLGILHKYFQPLSEEINDYIAKPKNNGYRSLHTTVLSKKNKITEIQIRTEEMHKEAEFGVCAHWAYKEGIDLEKNKGYFSWIEKPKDIAESFHIDFFEDQIFAFTPKGDVINLPKGSCPIDFAYAIHSEIGDKCESAKIGGKIVPLHQKLENGDIVEIITNKNKKPSKDWLRFVETNLAKSQIKKSVEELKSKFKFPIPRFITQKIVEITQARKKQKEEKLKIKQEKLGQIFLAGQKGILIHKAKCCNPQIEDKVKAYLAPHRMAVLHRTDCEIFKKIAEKFPEKIIDASWQ